MVPEPAPGVGTARGGGGVRQRSSPVHTNGLSGSSAQIFGYVPEKPMGRSSFLNQGNCLHQDLPGSNRLSRQRRIHFYL